MLNFSLSRVMSKSEEPKSESGAKVVALAVASNAMPAYVKALKGLDLSTEVSSEDEGVTFCKQEDFEAEGAQTIMISKDVSAVLSVEKAFTPFPDSLSFDDNLKAQGFLPGISVATEALMDTVREVLYKAESSEDAQSNLAKAIEDYSAYVQGLAGSLPVAAFKMEVMEVEEIEKDTASEEEASAETTANTDAEGEDAATDDAAAADEDATQAKKSEDEQEDGAVAAIAAGITKLTTAVESMTASIEEVKKEVSDVRDEAKKTADKVEAVEATVAKTEATLENTVLGTGGGEDRTDTDKNVKKSDDLWGGTTLDNLDLSAQ